MPKSLPFPQPHLHHHRLNRLPQKPSHRRSLRHVAAAALRHKPLAGAADLGSRRVHLQVHLVLRTEPAAGDPAVVIVGGGGGGGGGGERVALEGVGAAGHGAGEARGVDALGDAAVGGGGGVEVVVVAHDRRESETVRFIE